MRGLMLGALVLAACQPTFVHPLSLVVTPELLAVRGDPPEAALGASVLLTPLVASPAGTVAAPALDWSLCLQPKPSAENDVVNAACFASGGTTPVATGTASASVTMPTNACRLFGPNVPPRVAGQPPFAPPAPDATGGYYQPVVVELDGGSTVALERISCLPAGASLTLSTEFAMQYTPNQNPQLTALTALVNGNPTSLDSIPAGALVTFSVGWTPGSPETFPVVDTLDQTLVTHRESMDVSWYATAGEFENERTGRGENDLELDTSNAWTAPGTPGPVSAWLVLRDSRGGVDFSSYTLGVVAP